MEKQEHWVMLELEETLRWDLLSNPLKNRLNSLALSLSPSVPWLLDLKPVIA